MEVLNAIILRGKVSDFNNARFSANTESLSSSFTKSILCTRQNIFASGENSLIASSAP